MVLNCLYLARIGRPDIPWSVNKHARAVTKWTRSHAKRLARLISYIHHTSEYRYCHVGNTAQHCRLGLFQDSDFAGDLEDSNFNIRKNSMHFRQPNVRTNQLDVQETDFCFATPQSNMRKQIPTTNTNLDLTHVDHVPSSRTHFWFQCYVECLQRIMKP